MTAAAPRAGSRASRAISCVRRVLTAAGLSEAVTFGFIEARAAAAFAPTTRRATLVARRQSAVGQVRHAAAVAAAGPVDAVAHNRRHGRRDVGAVRDRRPLHAPQRRDARRRRSRGPERRRRSTGRAARREVDFFDVKGVVEQLCDALGVAVRVRAGDGAVSRRRAGGGRARRRCDGRRRRPAVAGTSPSARRAAAGHDLRRRAGSRSRLRARRARARRCGPAAAAPSVGRPRSVDRRRRHLACGDHSWHHSGGRPTARRGAARRRSRSSIGIKGKGVAEGAVSLSVRLTFQAPDRTLTDAEVQQSVRQRFSRRSSREHGAVNDRRVMIRLWRRQRPAASSSNRSIGSRRS